MTSNFEPFFKRLWQNGDINEHLPVLFILGLQCQTIVEFGVREANSTIALMTALKMQSRHTTMFSYDQSPTYCNALDGSEHLTDTNTVWSYCQADTSKLESIPVCDLLFIDTLHTYDQVRAELKHSERVKRWIVLHDTVKWGQDGENEQRGIRPAIELFLHRHPHWKNLYEYRNNNGLMILERR